MVMNRVFIVNSDGTLQDKDYKELTQRKDLYDLSIDRLSDIHEILFEAGELQPFQWHLNDQMWGFLEEMEEVDRKKWPDEPEDCTEKWLLSLDDNNIKKLIESCNDWLESEPDYSNGEADYFHFPSNGQAFAFQYFYAESELQELFSIYIIEGDHPGSNYFAAEIEISADEANRIAAKENINIKFETI